MESLIGFALAFDRLVFNANTSVFVSEVSCSLSSYYLSIKSVTNLFFVHRFNFNFHSIFTLQVTGCDFQHGSNFGVPSNSTFRVS